MTDGRLRSNIQSVGLSRFQEIDNTSIATLHEHSCVHIRGDGGKLELVAIRLRAGDVHGSNIPDTTVAATLCHLKRVKLNGIA